MLPQHDGRHLVLGFTSLVREEEVRVQSSTEVYFSLRLISEYVYLVIIQRKEGNILFMFRTILLFVASYTKYT